MARIAEWRQACASHPDLRLRNLQMLVSPHVRHADAWRELGRDDASLVVVRPQQTLDALQVCDAVVTGDMTTVVEATALGRTVIAWPDPHLDKAGTAELDQFIDAYAEKAPYLRRVADLSGALAALTDETVSRSARHLVAPHGPDLSTSFFVRRVLAPEVMSNRVAPVPPAPPLPGWLGQVLPWLMHRASTAPVARPAPALTSARTILVVPPSGQMLDCHKPLVDGLLQQGHRVVVAWDARPASTGVTWDPAIVWAGRPASRQDRWTRVLGYLRGMAMAEPWQADDSRLADVPGRARYVARLLPPGGATVSRVLHRTGGRRLLLRRLAQWAAMIPDAPGAAALLEREQPEVLLSLPARDLAASQAGGAERADLLDAARRRGVLVVTIPANLDGTLDPALALSSPHAALVTNDAQRHNLRRAAEGQVDVRVCGAAGLDAWLDDRPGIKAKDFREALGLPPGPFALVVASTSLAHEPAREQAFVREWVSALRAHPSPAVRTIPVLIRPVPGATRDWTRVNFDGLGPVVLCPRQYEPDEALDGVLFAESVRFAAFVLSADPVALTLAAGYGVPACALAVGASEGACRALSRLYAAPQRWVSGLDAVLEATTRALRAKAAERADLHRVLRQTVRPEGAAYPAASRMLEEVADICRHTRPWPEVVPAGAPVIRGALLLGVRGLAVVSRIRGAGMISAPGGRAAGRQPSQARPTTPVAGR